jgi:hypothetical protein
MPSLNRICLLGLILGFALNLESQEPIPAVDNAFVQKEFGSSCTLNSAAPAVVGDLNNDSIPDIVIPARCKNPLTDAAENHYLVLDPYYAFYGFGDPRITTQFATSEPENRSLALLIIHGAGGDAWRTPGQTGKFLIVNLAYKQITIRKLQLKKKTVTAIYVNELGGDQTVSVLFWDGKKYKYQPMGSSME